MHGIMAVNMRPCRLRFAAAGNRAYIKSGDWYLRLFRLAWAGATAGATQMLLAAALAAPSVISP